MRVIKMPKNAFPNFHLNNSLDAKLLNFAENEEKTFIKD